MFNKTLDALLSDWCMYTARDADDYAHRYETVYTAIRDDPALITDGISFPAIYKANA